MRDGVEDESPEPDFVTDMEIDQMSDADVNTFDLSGGNDFGSDPGIESPRGSDRDDRPVENPPLTGSDGVSEDDFDQVH